jgi:hypothetical protein
VRPGVATGQRDGYTAALTGLWNRLARALGELESIASEPEELLDDEDVLERLPTLQYSLHAAAELVVGLRPPAGAETAHAELASALACARDATADVAEAAELGGAEAAEPLVPEWRGALFRVRLARLRVVTPPPLPAEEAIALPPPTGATALASLSLALCGALLFAGGASLALWPVWALGLALVAAAVLVYTPRP